MTAATTTVALSGIDEIDARRHLTGALVDILDGIDGEANPTETFDGAERRCVDVVAEAVAADALTNLWNASDALSGVANRISTITDPAVRQAVIRARQQLGTAVETADALRSALARGCPHACPTAGRTHAEADVFACELIDRLDTAGYALARSPR